MNKPRESRAAFSDPTVGKALAKIEAERYRRKIEGLRSKMAGEYFERQIANSLQWYEGRGEAKGDKTPEPMKPLQPYGKGGKFVACYTKKAQADFCGTLKGGRAFRFEAKQTDTGRFEQKRLTEEQMNDLREHDRLGALCFVMLCFGQDGFYRVPWADWENMKERFGHLYVTEKELAGYSVRCIRGVIRIFEGLEQKECWPDLCVACGDYAGEGSHICGRCEKEAEK